MYVHDIFVKIIYRDFTCPEVIHWRKIGIKHAMRYVFVRSLLFVSLKRVAFDNLGAEYIQIIINRRVLC